MLPTLASTSKANLLSHHRHEAFSQCFLAVPRHCALSLCSCHSIHLGAILPILKASPNSPLPSPAAAWPRMPPLATVCQDICPYPSPSPDPRLLGEARAIVSALDSTPSTWTRVLSICWDGPECQGADRGGASACTQAQGRTRLSHGTHTDSFSGEVAEVADKWFPPWVRDEEGEGALGPAWRVRAEAAPESGTGGRRPLSGPRGRKGRGLHPLSLHSSRATERNPRLPLCAPPSVRP